MNILTERNLVLLGIYEETLELYTSVKTILNRSFDSPWCVDTDSTDFYPREGERVEDYFRRIYPAIIKWKRFDELQTPMEKYIAQEDIDEIFLDMIVEYINKMQPILGMEYAQLSRDAQDYIVECDFPYIFLTDERRSEESGKPTSRVRYYTFLEFLERLQRIIVRCLGCVPREFLSPVQKISLKEASELFQRKINSAIKLKESGEDIFKRLRIGYALTSESQPIRVYTNLHNLACNQQKHSIIPKILRIKSLSDEATCNLPVNYCETCDIFFVGKNSLNIMRGIYGTLLVKTEPCTPEQCVGIKRDEFGGESELHSMGYVVGRNGLSEANRRCLLTYLLDNAVMSKFAIRRDIEHAINIFRDRDSHVDAVLDWQRDLMFVDRYGSDSDVG